MSYWEIHEICEREDAEPMDEHTTAIYNSGYQDGYNAAKAKYSAPNPLMMPR